MRQTCMKLKNIMMSVFLAVSFASYSQEKTELPAFKIIESTSENTERLVGKRIQHRSLNPIAVVTLNEERSNRESKKKLKSRR